MSYRRIAGEFVTPLSVVTGYYSMKQYDRHPLSQFSAQLSDADGHIILHIHTQRCQANLNDMANIARNLRWIAKEMNSENTTRTTEI